MKPLVAPSILAANFVHLQKDIEMINHSQADWLHFDVMDGLFVPNISFGIPVCEAVSKVSTKPLDVHLMIQNPEKYLEAFKRAGAGNITVHYEATMHLHSAIHQIKKLGCRAGVALNPHTPVHLLEEIITDIDIVLVMSVNPGFGGQQFIEQTYQKVKKLKNLILSKRSDALIEVDGGVNTQNAAALVAVGVDVLVAGNFVFSSPDPAKVIADLKNTIIHYEV